MKCREMLVLAVCAALAAGACASRKAADTPSAAAPAAGPAAAPGAPPAMPTPEEMGRMMAERAAIADEHRKMATLIGTWDADVQMWMGGPEATRSKGVAVTREALGGRVLVTDFESEMMGAPYRGFEMFGFDKETGIHWAHWSDSMGTGSLTFRGKRRADGSIEQTTGEYECMGARFTSRGVTRFEDQDHFTFELYSTTVGQPGEHKDMEIRYTRRR